MLRSLRKNAQSWMIKGVLWLVVAAFIGTIFLVWGRGGDVSKADMAAIVNDRVISMSQFYNAHQNLEQVYREVYGDLPENIIDRDTIKREALASLINRELRREAAEKLNIKVTEEEIQGTIAETPVFMINGQFNRDRYLEVLRRSGITPKDYEKETAIELKLKKLQSFIQSSVKISEKEIQDRYETLKREIRVRYLSIDPSGITVDNPSKIEISDYYNENKERFRTPAKVKIEYAYFNPDAFKDGAELSEAEITTFYEANQDRYPAPEMRRFHEIVLPYKNKQQRKENFEKARAILQDITSGKITFQDGIEQFSVPNSKGKNEKDRWYEREDLPRGAADEAFSLPVDGVTTAFDTGKEVMLLKIAEIRRPEPFPLSRVRENVIQDLKNEKSQDIAIIKAYEAKGRLAKGETFGEVIADYGLSSNTSSLISQDEAKPELKDIISSSYLLAVGEVGEVKKAGDSQILFRVVEKRDSSVKPLKEVEKEIISLVNREKKHQKARQRAQSIIGEAKKEGGLKKVASTYNLKVKTTPYFSPISPQPLSDISVSRELIENILSLGTVNLIAEKPVNSDGKFFVFAFAGEKEISLENYENEKGQIANILFEQKKAGAISAFIKEQREKSNIEISDDLKHLADSP